MPTKDKLPEEHIELHHPSIEEIMGTPPANMVSIGSGTILSIMIILLSCSLFFSYPDVVHTTVVVHGDELLTVITAPESGELDLHHFSGDKVTKNDTVLEISNIFSGICSTVVTTKSGVVEIDPIIAMKKRVQQNDTIGFIWDCKPTTSFCSVLLLPQQMKGIKVGNKLKITINQPTNTRIIETKIESIVNSRAGNKTLIIALLPNELREMELRGELNAPATIIIGEKTVFQRLINPFRSLIN